MATPSKGKGRRSNLTAVDLSLKGLTGRQLSAAINRDAKGLSGSEVGDIFAALFSEACDEENGIATGEAVAEFKVRGGKRDS